MKLAAIFLVPLLLAGCHGDTAAPGPVSVPGRYTLKTLNGDPVPAVFTETAALRLEFMKGVVTLNDDGTFTDSTELRRTEKQVVRRTIDVAQGSWRQVGDSIKLSSTRGERYSMMIGERSLEQKLGFTILIYRR